MLHQIMLLLSLAASDESSGCKGGEWGRVVAESESMILKQEPFNVPRDPLGAEYDRSCVRIVFQINERGDPINVKIAESSGSRAIDMVARETIKKFKLMVPDDRRKNFALVFEYPADAGESP